MKNTPCKYKVWNILPLIRKGIAESMINEYGLKQKEIAKKLCISHAAVSQYLSGKRGKIKITDKELKKEINKSAERIIKQGDEILVSETCRLCKLFSSNNYFRLKDTENINLKYCNKCGWMMEYRPRSFQEYIQEIIGDKDKRGYWKCPNCGSMINSKNME